MSCAEREKQRHWQHPQGPPGSKNSSTASETSGSSSFITAVDGRGSVPPHVHVLVVADFSSAGFGHKTATSVGRHRTLPRLGSEPVTAGRLEAVGWLRGLYTSRHASIIHSSHLLLHHITDDHCQLPPLSSLLTNNNFTISRHTDNTNFTFL